MAERVGSVGGALGGPPIIEGLIGDAISFRALAYRGRSPWFGPHRSCSPSHAATRRHSGKESGYWVESWDYPFQPFLLLGLAPGFSREVAQLTNIHAGAGFLDGLCTGIVHAHKSLLARRDTWHR